MAAQQVLAAPADLDAARLQLSLLLAQGGAQGSAGMAGEGDDDAEGMDIDSAGAEEEGGAAEHVPQQEGRGGGSSDGSSSTPAQLAEHVAALLTADPSDPSPLVLLLALHAEGVARGGRGLPPGVLSAGLAAYLDGQPPNWCPPALELVGEALVLHKDARRTLHEGGRAGEHEGGRSRGCWGGEEGDAHSTHSTRAAQPGSSSARLWWV